MFLSKEREAEAMFIRRQREADADLIARQKEAKGLIEMAKAYGALGEVLGGPQGLMQWFMLQNNTHEKLALANAKAINGLAPKINVWNTGNQDGGGGGGGDASAPLRNLFQSLPPLFSTIQDQTGISPPNWLAQMPAQTGALGQADQQVAKVPAKNDVRNGANGHQYD